MKAPLKNPSANLCRAIHLLDQIEAGLNDGLLPQPTVFTTLDDALKNSLADPRQRDHARRQLRALEHAVAIRSAVFKTPLKKIQELIA